MNGMTGVIDMFIKIQSLDTANILKAAGFKCIVETVNGTKFYCFEQCPELAKIILDKFADEHLVLDDHLHF